QGTFRPRENAVEIYLPSGEEIILVEFEKNAISAIRKKSVALAAIPEMIGAFRIFPAKHFVTPKDKLLLAILRIKDELRSQIEKFKKEGKVLELERIKQRTNFDLEMLQNAGYVAGIENYSRHFSFRDAGDPPYTLIDYFPRTPDGRADFLTVIDESHATIPQVRGMYNGDQARKLTLVNYGFRLPSALDNRPLKFEEFRNKTAQTIYASATPADYEYKVSQNKKGVRYVAEQVIRPTGLIDPELEVRPTQNQIRDLVIEIKKRVAKKERALVIALTKRLAEDVAQYLSDQGIKTTYLHSEIKTLDRPDILTDLRKGEYDVLVGINLLREGLDLPEVSFIGILDADKEGFLRNDRTLLQIIGRAARHLDGKVILYGDVITDSMKRAMDETNRRRKIQAEYNKKHKITPTQIVKAIRKTLSEEVKETADEPSFVTEGPKKKLRDSLVHEMRKAAKSMNFELAARIRDRIRKLDSSAA
ncbi:MAG: excinuclease ABC subunit B, partial [Candidatus Sungbacteria bacterium RIFCSPLOWO2_02_FULL_48_13b]